MLQEGVQSVRGLEGQNLNPTLPLTPFVTLGSPSSCYHVAKRLILSPGAAGYW